MHYSIVVAEDELLLLNNLIQKINATGLFFEVVGFAQTGIQAYELIEEHQPDLLITDIRMPAMDGLSLIQKVRSYYPDIDCVIVSGFSEFEYAKKAIRYQVTDYLLKPIDTDALYDTLLALQNKYLSRDQNYKEIFCHDLSGKSSHEIALGLQTYMLDHYNEDFKLSDIAEQMNYSSSYLSKIFIQEFGCSPSKYLISLRIQKAQQLLKHNRELSVRQIGEAVGYPEQGYFSRIFKKHVGTSPVDCREVNPNKNM